MVNQCEHILRGNDSSYITDSSKQLKLIMLYQSFNYYS